MENKKLADWNPKLYQKKHAFVYNFGTDLVQLLDPKKNESILDVGCGTGQLTAEIAQIAKRVVGIDASESMIEEAKSTYPKPSFLVADAANFKLEESFDAIFSNAALHWVINYQAAINNMYTHLNMEGRLVIEMGGKNNIKTIINALRMVLAINGFKQQSTIKVWYFPSIGQYCSALEETGFHISSAQLYDRPTVLSDDKKGIIDWLQMFGSPFFKGIPKGQQEEIRNTVQELIKPTCFIGGKWVADYKRLRIVALKK